MRNFLRRLGHFLRPESSAADLEEEMRLHQQLRAETLVRDGMSPADATLESRRRFGNTIAVGERSQDVWGMGTLDAARGDIRLAARRLRQHPALSVPTIVVLALGIGATTAVFSAIDATILRPLPFARPSELVTLTSVDVPFEASEGLSRLVNLRQVREMRDLFARASAYAAGGLNLDDPEHPRRVKAGVVTVDFFTTLGVRPSAGRNFSEEEGKPRAGGAVILSHALWQQQFGGRDVIGSTITLQGNRHQVVGIMPAGFNFPAESELWIPMSVPTTSQTFAPFRGYLPSRVVARLAPGVSIEAADARLMSAWEQSLVGSDPRSSLKEWVADVQKKGAALPLQSTLAGDKSKPLAILMGATVLLLLIACANVANLLLTDAARRRREVALRQALGASPGRIVRQLLAESVMLAAAGAVLGLALAPAALSLLRALLPADLAGIAPARLDLRVLGFTASLAFITGVAFGLWPARQAAGENASNTLKSGGGHGATARGGRARRTLVTLELALTVMLLVGAGLMIRSFERVLAEDLGMRTERVATLEMTFARGASGTPQSERLRIISGALDQLASAGVQAGVVNDLPLRGGGGIGLTFDVDGTPPARTMEEMKFARMLYASPGYFATMGIPLLRGRLYEAAQENAPRVAVISRAMADRYWKEDALGRTFRFAGDTAPITVVGIVADVRESSVERDPEPQMYFPLHPRVPDNVALVARSTLPAEALLQRLRDVVRQTAPRQAVYNVRAMDEVLDTALAPRRTNTLLIAIFAGVALVLAALGVYAVLAFGVAQRAREFGIRMALGATGGDVMRLVSREMVLIVGLGIALGLAGALALTRVLASMLYGVEQRDPATFIAVPVVLLVAALLATLVPAVRATRVNPTDVMRAD